MLGSVYFWIPFEICNNAFYGFLFVFFTNCLLTKRNREKISLWACAALISAIYSAYLFIPEQTLKLYFSDSWVYVIILVYMVLFYKDNWWTKLLWFTVLVSISSTTASFSYYLFSEAFHVTFEELLNPGSIRVVFLIFAGATLFGMCFSITRLYAPIKGNYFFSIQPVLIITFINLITILTEEIMFHLYPEGEFSSQLFLYICVQSLSICMLSLFLYRSIYHYSNRIMQLQLQRQEREEVQERLNEANRLFDIIHKLDHDMKKHIDIVMDLMSQGNTVEAEKYMNDVKEKHPVMISTGCVSLDSALMLRERLMEEQNITFLPELCDLSRLPLKEVEFCTIIMNLLDNAIEAEKRYRNEIPDCYVKLEIRIVKEMLLIRCTNACTTIPLKKNGNSYFSAKRTSGIGMGIPIIETIVNENHGLCNWEQQDNRFVANISLPIESTMMTTD